MTYDQVTWFGVFGIALALFCVVMGVRFGGK